MYRPAASPCASPISTWSQLVEESGDWGEFGDVEEDVTSGVCTVERTGEARWLLGHLPPTARDAASVGIPPRVGAVIGIHPESL